jgi:hypothetical protein
MNELYETDFVLWAERQADALRRRAANEIDWENVAEAIESLARSDRREIRNQLAIICAHLLKRAYLQGRRSRSWDEAIVEARIEIAGLLEESPSLHSYPASVLAKAYADGRSKAATESGLAELPENCPWTSDQVLSHEFMPDGPTTLIA